MNFYKLFITFFLVGSATLISSTAAANSSLRGVYSYRNHQLTIEIRDNPSKPPYTGGKIWQSLKPDHVDKQGYRFVKTKNFHLICNGSVEPSGDVYGHCLIQVSDQTIYANSRYYNFTIKNGEARTALDGLVGGIDVRNFASENLLHDQFGFAHEVFGFEQNWLNGTITGYINGELVRHEE